MQTNKMMLLVAILAAGVTTGVLADPPPPGTQQEGGYPIRRWLWSIPSDTGRYIGYYVGGGNGRPHKTEARRDDEGTWGWDYQGWLPRHINLGWWHGQKNQGGTGSYRTDGPHLYEEGK